MVPRAAEVCSEWVCVCVFGPHRDEEQRDDARRAVSDVQRPEPREVIRANMLEDSPYLMHGCHLTSSAPNRASKTGSSGRSAARTNVATGSHCPQCRGDLGPSRWRTVHVASDRHRQPLLPAAEVIRAYVCLMSPYLPHGLPAARRRPPRPGGRAAGRLRSRPAAQAPGRTIQGTTGHGDRSGWRSRRVDHDVYLPMYL